jgi:hypothetical protein
MYLFNEDIDTDCDLQLDNDFLNITPKA